MDLPDAVGEWLSGTGPENDIVMSTLQTLLKQIHG